MTTLGKLLGSPARTELLRVLVYQGGAVGVRSAARIAGMHPHSAGLALKALVREDLVRRRQTTVGPLYELNPTHPDVPVLEAVFCAAAAACTRQRQSSLHRKGRAILPFIDEATRMLNKARSHRHVA